MRALFFLTLTSLTLTACSPAPDETMTESQAVISEAATASTEVFVPLVAPKSSAPLAKYAHLDPLRLVPTDLLSKAVLYFDANPSLFTNKKYISVIDFSKSSRLKRFFIIDMKSGSVWAIHTAHGKGSDANHDGLAEKFSNMSGSNASSLGFYKAAETYSGKYGKSLRLDGLSSTNSNARARAVVVHGANYVSETNVIQGRSWGCPAVAMGHKDKVIDMIKGGSLIYAGLAGK